MAYGIITNPVLLAFLGGIIPPLIWLWFWLQEDKKHPEPKGLIAITFICGMIAVPIAVFLENLSLGFFPVLTNTLAGKLLLWATIEEILKFLAIYLGAFKTTFFDEPIDAVIYMITAALGFAALENVLFLYGTLGSGGYLDWLITGNSRFLGATLLHAISSSFVGIAIGYTFYKKNWIRACAFFLGLILAISLHGAFNFLIIEDEGANIMKVFFALWVIAILCMIVFEKVRRVHPQKRGGISRY